MSSYLVALISLLLRPLPCCPDRCPGHPCPYSKSFVQTLTQTLYPGLWPLPKPIRFHLIRHSRWDLSTGLGDDYAKWPATFAGWIVLVETTFALFIAAAASDKTSFVHIRTKIALMKHHNPPHPFCLACRGSFVICLFSCVPPSTSLLEVLCSPSVDNTHDFDFVLLCKTSHVVITNHS